MVDKKQKIPFQIFKDLLINSRRIIGIMWQDHKRLVFIIGSLFFVVGAAPFVISGAQGVLINELIDSTRTGTATSALWGALIVFLSIGILVSLVTTVEKYFDRVFWFTIQEKFELLFLKKRGEIDIARYEDPKYNDLFQKVTENGIFRIHGFTERQLYLFQNIFEVILAGAILIFAEWWIFLIVFLGVLPEMIIEGRHGRRVWNIYGGRAEVRRRYIDLASYFDSLPKITELRLFQNTRFFFSAIKDLLQSFHKEELKNERKKIGSELVSMLFSQVVLIFAIFWLVGEVLSGRLQIGTLTFYLASIIGLRRSLSGFFLNVGRQYQDSLFVTDAFKMLDITPVVAHQEKAFILNQDITPEIFFDRVTFSYSGASAPALKNFSLIIASGEKIALVGTNGAGKTTLIKLLCRFYEPTEGRILIGGKDLREINLESWYGMLGILFQDYANYHFLVREAIAVGRTEKPQSSEKIQQSAEASEADAFISNWDKAYEQMLGKEFTGGVEPSIGQWQKLALARTFYRDPRVLVLDEPTSSIDAESEAKIFEKIDTHGFTAVVL